jgi:hypothetical protein
LNHKSAVTVVLCAGVLATFAVAAVAQESPDAPGSRMPKPWGVGVTYYQQAQPYKIESLTMSLPGIDPAVAKGLDVHNFTETLHATFDYWLLPFLDVQVLFGKLESNTKVGLSELNVGIPLADLDVKSKGLVYGAGATLAYGTDRFFGTLTGQYTDTRLDEEGASVTAWTVTPKLGMTLGKSAAAWVGAMYQKPQEDHQGSYNVPPFGTVPYKVHLTAENMWGYLAGASYGLGEHWLLVAEGGFGQRTALLVHLDYRW